MYLNRIFGVFVPILLLSMLAVYSQLTGVNFTLPSRDQFEIELVDGRRIVTLSEKLKAQTEEAGRNQVVMQPPTIRGDRFDPCDVHAVLAEMGEKPQPTQSARSWRYEIIDFFVVTEICDRPIETLLKEQWNIREDAENYPVTYRSRAHSRMSSAERLLASEMDPVAQANAEGEIEAANIALRQAARLYDSDARFQLSMGTARFNRLMAEIESDIKFNEVNLNRVTDSPRHEMILIPAGSILRPKDNEEDLERIGVSSFWIDRFEVSNHQFALSRPISYDDVELPTNAKPVVGIPFKDAAEYCSHLGLRLPTLVEIQRAGLWGPQFDEDRDRTRKFPWGDDEQRLGPNDNAVLTRVQDDPTGGSLYGVLNLATNAPEWVSAKFEQQVSLVLGGLGTKLDDLNLLFGRAVNDPQDIGFRCVYRPVDENDKPNSVVNVLLRD